MPHSGLRPNKDVETSTSWCKGIQGYASDYCHNLVIVIVQIMMYLWQHCTKNDKNKEINHMGSYHPTLFWWNFQYTVANTECLLSL